MRVLSKKKLQFLLEKEMQRIIEKNTDPKTVIALTQELDKREADHWLIKNHYESRLEYLQNEVNQLRKELVFANDRIEQLKYSGGEK